MTEKKKNYFSSQKAMLEMSKPIKFSKTVQPICISSSSSSSSGKNKTYVNESVLISGWGNTAEEFNVGML